MSLHFRQNVSLKPFNTFAIETSARCFTELANLADLPPLLASDEYRNGQPFWLGGGSNILLCGDLDRLVVKVALHGIQLIEESADSVLIEVAAGEPWHEFVQHSLAQGWYGLENLSLIPGTVGASPVQNIGAYGVEVKDAIEQVICADLTANGTPLSLTASACEFAYRDSIFKRTMRERLLITAVRFRLNKRPLAQTNYGDIRRQLDTMQIGPAPTPQQVAEAIIALRRSKLPDPTELGNAGSFFKNPLVDTATAERLLAAYPQMPHYPASDGRVKLAAGWLIDQAGLKGYRQGDAGVHERQALVLVNYGQTSGNEIRQLSDHIRQVIAERYGVALEPEPCMLV